MGREEGSGWGTHVYLWCIHILCIFSCELEECLKKVFCSCRHNSAYLFVINI